jgi:hypothetical protein
MSRMHAPKVLLCVLGLFLIAIELPGQDRAVRVDRELQRLFNQTGHLFLDLCSGDTNSPFGQLQREGLFGVQAMIPYLTNTSPTKLNVREKRGGEYTNRSVAVNEVVAHVITRIADHQFYLMSGEYTMLTLGEIASVNDPMVLHWFQFQVEHWTAIHVNKSVLARKIADLNDACHLNRFDAYRWFKDSRSAEGRVPIERRIAFLLDEARLNTLSQSEMTACAEALAAIGDWRSVPAAQRVCDHLWKNPIHASGRIEEVSRAYRALSSLGQRERALAELKSYSDKYSETLEPRTGRELAQVLKEAEDW